MESYAALKALLEAIARNHPYAVEMAPHARRWEPAQRSLQPQPIQRAHCGLTFARTADGLNRDILFTIALPSATMDPSVPRRPGATFMLGRADTSGNTCYWPRVFPCTPPASEQPSAFLPAVCYHYLLEPDALSPPRPIAAEFKRST